MSTNELEALGRRARAEPDNEELQVRYVTLSGRHNGPDAFLRVLAERQQWNKAPTGVQDLAIKEVGRRLGTAFSYSRTSDYMVAEVGHRIATFQHKATGIEFQLLPAGHFHMGSLQTDPLKCSDESPYHEVTISKPFLLANFPITVDQWELAEEGHKLPKTGISWHDCGAWLEQIGDGLRFPSESEWEYACRAGTSTRYFWGDEWDPSFGWTTNNSHGKAAEKELHQDFANPFGLIDLLGNVYEWCADNWFQDYTLGPTTEEVCSDEQKDAHISRGGGWNIEPRYCRSADRFRFEPEYTSDFLGLRPARSIDCPSFSRDQ